MNTNIKERIRILIGAMGDDEFERFMSDLLPRIFPGFDKLEPSFNFIGKTTKGKCDAHVYHAHDDTYTPIICTTRQSGLPQKILDDISKLSTTKFSKKIQRVLLCVNSSLKDEVEDYRAACRERGWEMEALSLEALTKHTISQYDLLHIYFNETYQKASGSTQGGLRRFDCGERIEEARKDINKSISELIELIDFPSEREWHSIEKKEHEISEKHITKLSILTGVSSSWIKHGTYVKYPADIVYDNHIEKIDAIPCDKISSYMMIEPESMSISLIVQKSEYNWGVYLFGFTLDFWRWIGDEHHIPLIYHLLEHINNKLRTPYGRVITKELLQEIRSGQTHPSYIIKKSGNMHYWFDDLFDLHHKYPIAKEQYKHHGEWFVRLQQSFLRHTA